MTHNETCAWTKSQWTQTRTAEYAAQQVITPLHFALGVPGHLLSLLAFYKQSKLEKAYTYQIYAVASELVEILGFDAMIFSYFYWSGAGGFGNPWFMSQYPLMWYSAHVAVPFMHM